MQATRATQLLVDQESLTLHEEFVHLRIQPFDDLHAIRVLGNCLEQSGIVRRTFTAAVVERERILPTGVALPGGINLAIPHTDAYFVHRTTLAIATFRQPVHFCHMDHLQQRVPVHVVCMPVVANVRAFSGVVAAVLHVLQQPHVLETIYGARHPHAVIHTLESRLFNVLQA